MAPAGPARRSFSPAFAALVGAFALLVAAGGLVAFKASSALAALGKAQATGTLAGKKEWIATAGLDGWLRPLAATANYFAWVLVALAFGVLIGAIVRALLPERWLVRTLAAPGARGQLYAALVGTPLMLCSCCVAPVFDGVYTRTRRLGPALGLMIAAPALNPAALALTFVLFPAHLAAGRLVLSLVLVLVASAGLGRLFVDRQPPARCPVDAPAATGRELAVAFFAALRQVAMRSLPAIVLGVVLSAVLAQAVPVRGLVHAGWGPLVVVLVAVVSVLVALPTFGEIPLALALHAAGAPDAAVLALLVAGPAINLPSLLTVRQVVSGRVALATGCTVLVTTLAGAAVISLV